MPLRRARVVLPLLLLGAAPVQTVQQTTPGARVCVAKDFGIPNPPTPSVDAIWNQDPGRLAEGPDGQIYSTSPSGGKYGRGTIWRHDPSSGKYEVLYHFPLADTTGSGSRSGLIAARGADGRPTGTFYGSAYLGGRWGVGTIFRYTIGASKPEVLFHLRNGRMTGLVPRECPTPTTCRYSGRQRADASGGYPTSAPVVTLDGAVYGVTYYSNNQGLGVLYKLGGGEEGLTAICVFDLRMAADKDMAPFVCHPRVYGASTVVLGTDGRTLYGTTIGGHGSLWRSTGGFPQVLHEFKGTDGSKPVNVMQGSNGSLYGTTWAGGPVNAGTVYLHSPGSSGVTTLTDFHIDPSVGNFSPGVNPAGGLVERLDTLNNNPSTMERSLYGSAKFGGRGGRGTIYRISPDGTGFRVVHHFPSSWGESGRSPLGALMLHSSGAIYGTTYQGGLYDGGVLWRLTGAGLPQVPMPSSPILYTLGAVAKDMTGKELKDQYLTVRTGVCAYQVASQCADSTYHARDAIKFEARSCRNPHYVQFISREELDVSTTPATPRAGTAALGYALTTDPLNRVWDVDVGRSTSADAFWENVPGNPVVRGPSSLFNADAPSTGSSATNAAATDIRRALFRTYLYCNCQLTRVVYWMRVQEGTAKSRYTEMSIRIPTADDQTFIDTHLKAQGFVPVP